MYFSVKLRGFEGFFIPTRKTIGQLNFSKFFKTLDRGLRGGSKILPSYMSDLVVKF